MILFILFLLYFVAGCKSILMSRVSILLDMAAQHVLEILGIWMNLLLLLFQKMVSLRLYSDCDIDNG